MSKGNVSFKIPAYDDSVDKTGQSSTPVFFFNVKFTNVLYS